MTFKSIMRLAFFVMILSSCRENKISTKSENKAIITDPSYATLQNLKGSVIEYSETQFLDADTMKVSKGNKSTYILDSEGRLLEHKHVGFSKKIITLERRFRKNGTEICVIHNGDGLEIRNFKTETIISGNIITKKYYDNYQSLENIARLTYDSKNNLLKTEIFKDNILVDKTTFKYDKDNNCVEELGYDFSRSKTKPFIKSIFKFDKNGNKISENHLQLMNDYKVEDPCYKWKYIYNKSGNWIKKFHFASNHSTAYMREEREYINP